MSTNPDQQSPSIEGAEPIEIASEQDQTDQGSLEEPLLLEGVKENAADANRDLRKGHAVWRDISGVIEEYLQNREVEIEKIVLGLLSKQKKECKDLAAEQDKEQEAVRGSTRERLGAFFSRNARRVYEGAKTGLDLVPDVQKLVDNLDIAADSEQGSVKKNLIEALNVAGGVRAFSVEKGIIDHEGGKNSRLKSIITGVNSFLENNEGVRKWLQGIIKTVITKE